MAEVRESITNKLAISSYFMPNRNILVFLREEGEGNSYKTLILEAGESSFSIESPLLLPELKKGSLLFFKMFPPDGFYIEFSSILTETFILNKKNYLKIAFPHEVIKTQRRDTFRVPVSIPAKLTFKKNRFETLSDAEATLVDLSLGGGLISTHLNLEPGGLGKVAFSIPEETGLLELGIRVKRQKEIIHQKSKYAYSIGVEFTALTEEESQRLSRYITRLQLLERKRK